MIKIKKYLLSWIHSSPEEVVLALGISGLVMIVAMIFCFMLIFNTSNTNGLPSNIPVNTKMSNGWKFLSRDKAGTSICDLYQKGMSYKVKCYVQNDDGKWILSEVF